MSNLLCQILVLLSTNQTVHWPQKKIEIIPPPGQFWLTTNSITINGHDWSWGDDTNADSNSVETTVTREYWIVVPMRREWNECRFRLDSDIVQHYSVEQRRVRTNAIADIMIQSLGLHPELSLTNIIEVPPPPTLKEYSEGRSRMVRVSYPTNWFEPVATNDLTTISPITIIGLLHWAPLDATNSSQGRYERRKKP